MRYLLFLSLFAFAMAQDKIEIKRTYYESGELSSETRYVNGKQEGEAKRFYPSGQIRREILYKNGKDVSIKAYYSDGSLRADVDTQQDVHKIKILNQDGEAFVDHEIHGDPNNKDRATLFIKEKDYTTQFKIEKYEAIEAPKVIFKDDPTRKDGEIIEYNERDDIESYVKVRDGRFDGEALSNYGTYKYIDNFTNGKLNGMRKRYQDGVLITEIEFKDNQKSGIFREYYDDGTLKHEGFYEKDKLIGEFVEYREDGSVKSKMLFDKNGKTMRKLFDKEGKLLSIVNLSNSTTLNPQDINTTQNYQQTMLYPNGKPYREFNRTKKGDRVSIYYPSGELKFVIPFTKHKANGEAKKYYKNGKLRALIPMSNNKIDGTISVYYPNGNSLKYHLPYKKNLLSGTKIKYEPKRQTMDYNITYSDGAINLSKPFAFRDSSCNTIVYYENKRVEYNISCKKEAKSIKGYYQNGMIEYEINYQKDKKEGLSYLYYGDREFDELTHLGSLTHEPVFQNSLYQELKFANDLLNGESKIYKQNGELIKEINYKNGRKEGLTTQFGITSYGNKPTTTKTEYKDDKKDGSERYYEEGELKRETQYKKGIKDGKEMQKEWDGETLSYYKNGKKDGFETKYNKNGEVYDGKEYRDGEIVYEIEEIINE